MKRQAITLFISAVLMTACTYTLEYDNNYNSEVDNGVGDVVNIESNVGDGDDGDDGDEGDEGNNENNENMYCNGKDECQPCPENKPDTFYICGLEQIKNYRNGHGGITNLVFAGNVSLCNDEESCNNWESIDLDGIKDVYGYDDQMATITAKVALPKPLFSNVSDVKIHDLDLDYDVTLGAGDDNAHAALANKASNVTLSKITFSGSLIKSKEDGIKNVGAFIGELKNDSNDGRAPELNELKVINTKIDIQQGAIISVGGFFGTVEGTIVIKSPVIEKLDISANQSSYVGGLVGWINSATITIMNSSIGNLLIKNAERDSSSMIGHINNADVNISNAEIIINAIETSIHCSGGVIGYQNQGSIKINDTNITILDGLRAGSYAGGVLGLTDGTQAITLDNVHVNAYEIHSILDTNIKEETGSYAGGIAGAIKNLKGDLAFTDVSSIVNSIQATEKYAGGVVGALINDSEQYQIEIKIVSNFVNKISSKKFAGGLIGSLNNIRKNLQIVLIQNYASLLHIFDNNNNLCGGDSSNANGSTPGGVIGGQENSTRSSSISFSNIVTYSYRKQEEIEQSSCAVTQAKGCPDSKFDKVYFYDASSDRTDTACRCGTPKKNIYSFNDSGIYSYNEKENGFNLDNVDNKSWDPTEIKTDEGKTISMPLFDKSMLNGDSTIKWPELTEGE